MTKLEFVTELREKLSGLPNQDIEERLSFYGEMIDDRIEEGRTEEEAIADIGSVDEISAQIIRDIPLTKIVKERIKTKRRLRTWEIVFLVLGFPIWFSLAVATFAVILSLYVVLWSVIVSLWAVFVSLVACAFFGVVSGFVFTFSGNTFTRIATIGAGIVCAGLSIFFFFGCKVAAKGIILLTQKIALSFKKSFVKKENV